MGNDVITEQQANLNDVTNEQQVNIDVGVAFFISKKMLDVIHKALSIFIIVILSVGGIYIFLKHPSRNDISLILVAVGNIVSVILSLMITAITFIKSKSYFSRLSGIFIFVLAVLMTVSTFYQYISKPIFVEGWIPLTPIKSPIDIEIEMDKDGFSDSITNNYNPKIYPFVGNDNDLKSILLESNSIFDFFENSGILDKSNHRTFSIAKSITLNSSNSIIPEFNKTYGNVLRDANEQYIELKKGYFVSQELQTMGIDDAITTYGTMLYNLEVAKEWSINNANGVDLDLIALIARNYKEKAYLSVLRDDTGDSAMAIDDYIKSIEEYALLYRICKREHLDSKIDDYHILYWIAAIYHNMGDIQREGAIYRLAEFTTADAFFGKQVEFKTDAYFKAYSRYYSAMASHKMYLMIKSKSPKEYPRELKYYLQEAFTNYILSRDSGVLSSKERLNARDAVPQIADACLEYLYQYPDEENGDIMKSKQYYMK